MSDQQALLLLSLVRDYVTEYDSVDSIVDMAADLAMSMDKTTASADALRQEIEAALS